MKKIYYSWQDIERQCQSIVNQLAQDQWLPDYIVGITRGGNIPATIISHMLNTRCEALKVSLRDSDSESESNSWMAEDAFGYVHEKDYQSRWDVSLRKNILIVDDINDTGKTLEWIKNDWESSCFKNEQHAWKSVWGNTVRFAVLTNNAASDFVDELYYATEINKMEEPSWIVYPWECVGEYIDNA